MDADHSAVKHSTYHLISPALVDALNHLLPVGVLLLQFFPVTLLHATQAAEISLCWARLLRHIANDLRCIPKESQGIWVTAVFFQWHYSMLRKLLTSASVGPAFCDTQQTRYTPKQ